MQGYLKMAKSNADNHYAEVENDPSQGASGTGDRHETETADDSA
jgi:hypothetical protein